MIWFLFGNINTSTTVFKFNINSFYKFRSSFFFSNCEVSNVSSNFCCFLCLLPIFADFPDDSSLYDKVCPVSGVWNTCVEPIFCADETLFLSDFCTLFCRRFAINRICFGTYWKRRSATSTKNRQIASARSQFVSGYPSFILLEIRVHIDSSSVMILPYCCAKFK